MSDRLVGVRAKIERAKHHIRDLEGQLHAFRELRPYRLFTEPDADVGHHLYKIRVHADIPPGLAIVAGEVVHQLRSSLDHLAWQLWDANGRVKSESSVYFPVYESEAEYIDKRPTKVEGVFAPAAVSVLDAIQPHAAGNDLLWRLHKLNNIDKHRHLSVVAGVVESMGVEFFSGFLPSGKTIPVPLSVPKPLSSDGQLRVIEDGAVLCAIGSFMHPGGGPPNMQMNLQVAFEIVFGDPRVVRGEAVLPLLHQLAGLTDSIVDLFVPLL